MQPLQIERQADQTPLASGGWLAAQRELAKAQHLLTNTDHRLDRAFAQAVNRFPDGSLELVGHFEPGRRVGGGRVGQSGKALVPARVMRIAPRGNIWLDVAPLTR